MSTPRKKRGRGGEKKDGGGKRAERGREGLGMTGRDDSVMLSPFVYGDRF